MNPRGHDSARRVLDATAGLAAMLRVGARFWEAVADGAQPRELWAELVAAQRADHARDAGRGLVGIADGASPLLARVVRELASGAEAAATVAEAALADGDRTQAGIAFALGMSARRIEVLREAVERILRMEAAGHHES